MMLNGKRNPLQIAEELSSQWKMLRLEILWSQRKKIHHRTFGAGHWEIRKLMNIKDWSRMQSGFSLIFFRVFKLGMVLHPWSSFTGFYLICRICFKSHLISLFHSSPLLTTDGTIIRIRTQFFVCIFFIIGSYTI